MMVRRRSDARLRMRARISMMPAGSRPLVGSSRMIRVGSPREGGGDAQALFHSGRAGGELAGGEGAGHADGFQQGINGVGVAVGIAVGVTGGLGVKSLQAAQVVAAGQVRPEGGAVNQGAGLAQGGAVSGGAGLPQQGDAAGGGAQEAGQQGQQGGLAGTVGAEESVHAAGRDVQGDAVNGGDAPETLGQAGYGYGGGGGGRGDSHCHLTGLAGVGRRSWCGG